MKSNQLKLSLLEVMNYCKVENRFQQRVYANRIHHGNMNPAEANRNYMIIRKLGEWAAELERKGYKYADFEKIIKQLPDTRGKKSTQGRLFSSSNPVQK